jgi:uncharacterized protein (TIGR02145 family)
MMLLFSFALQEQVKNIDGKISKTISIGNQTWMAENLATILFKNKEYMSPHYIK